MSDAGEGDDRPGGDAAGSDGGDSGSEGAGPGAGGAESGNAGAGSDEAGGGDMTLAFTLAALRRLAEPKVAVADARTWSSHVGIVSDRPEGVVGSYAKRHRIRRDFFPGSRDKRRSLYYLRRRFPTRRHVLVGTGAPDEAAANEMGWEYLPVEEAAEKAGWSLDPEAEDAGGDDGDDGGFLGPLKRLTRLF